VFREQLELLGRNIQRIHGAILHHAFVRRSEARGACAFEKRLRSRLLRFPRIPIEIGWTKRVQLTRRRLANENARNNSRSVRILVAAARLRA
jgi:hypothetical protein